MCFKIKLFTCVHILKFEILSFLFALRSQFEFFGNVLQDKILWIIHKNAKVHVFSFVSSLAVYCFLPFSSIFFSFLLYFRKLQYSKYRWSKTVLSKFGIIILCIVQAKNKIHRYLQFSIVKLKISILICNFSFDFFMNLF